MNMTPTKLQAALQNLPVDAKESVVESLFVEQYLMEALGFEKGEVYPKYPTGDSKVADYAARKNTPDNIFVCTQENPYLLVEVKNRQTNLSYNSPGYISAVEQLKKYLLDKRCRSCKWGIITNANHIQLFRKHGKTVYPATKCLELTVENIDEIVSNIKQTIDSPKKALTIVVYNLRGGVGKTTTTANLAAVFAMFEKRVLVVDFDPSQQDLTKFLGLQLSNGDVIQNLVDRKADIRAVLKTYSYYNKKVKKDFSFDVLPADKMLANDNALNPKEANLNQQLRIKDLKSKLDSLSSDYDYIVIDSSPNWNFFSQRALYSADVILLPILPNDYFSLPNTVKTISEHIPKIQALREDGCPIALPIFQNGSKVTESQNRQIEQEIDNLIYQAKSDIKFDLKPYFYPKNKDGKNDKSIFSVSSHAVIANAIFSRTPAAFQNKLVCQQYLALAKEYFLQ